MIRFRRCSEQEKEHRDRSCFRARSKHALFGAVYNILERKQRDLLGRIPRKLFDSRRKAGLRKEREMSLRVRHQFNFLFQVH